MRKLTLYGKPGCHLCDDARAAVAEVREEMDLEVEEVDISLDPRLFREYGERIPVLDVDGEEALELGFDAPALRKLLGRVDA
ncbi:MAG TPA: glutaredoxin family protein [Thermoleophilaceae bacterium]|nr:glutaredoxin family protein [Thermoleophilaceae bacterium]